MRAEEKYKLLENGLSDPRNELCDEYKSKYGDYERHGGYRERGEGVTGPGNPEIRLVYHVPRFRCQIPFGLGY